MTPLLCIGAVILSSKLLMSTTFDPAFHNLTLPSFQSEIIGELVFLSNGQLGTNGQFGSTVAVNNNTTYHLASGRENVSFKIEWKDIILNADKTEIVSHDIQVIPTLSMLPFMTTYENTSKFESHPILFDNTQESTIIDSLTYIVGLRYLNDGIPNAIYAGMIIFDPIQQQFVSPATYQYTLPIIVDFPCVTNNSTHVWVIGGVANGLSEYLNDVQIYNIMQDEWGFGPNLNVARSHSGCAFSPNYDYLYVMAGYNADQSPNAGCWACDLLTSVERYNAENKSWSIVYDVWPSRAGLQCIPNTFENSIICIGGMTGYTAPINNIYIIDTFSNSFYHPSDNRRWNGSAWIDHYRFEGITVSGYSTFMYPYDGETNILFLINYDNVLYYTILQPPDPTSSPTTQPTTSPFEICEYYSSFTPRNRDEYPDPCCEAPIITNYMCEFYGYCVNTYNSFCNELDHGVPSKLVDYEWSMCDILIYYQPINGWYSTDIQLSDNAELWVKQMLLCLQQNIMDALLQQFDEPSTVYTCSGIDTFAQSLYYQCYLGPLYSSLVNQSYVSVCEISEDWDSLFTFFEYIDIFRIKWRSTKPFLYTINECIRMRGYNYVDPNKKIYEFVLYVEVPDFNAIWNQYQNESISMSVLDLGDRILSRLYSGNNQNKQYIIDIINNTWINIEFIAITNDETLIQEDIIDRACYYVESVEFDEVSIIQRTQKISFAVRDIKINESTPSLCPIETTPSPTDHDDDLDDSKGALFEFISCGVAVCCLMIFLLLPS